MATKKAAPPPIDRPLQKAYLRKFSGWSTAFPPNLSEPNSCRTMENLLVSRDSGIRVRPGLRYLSYVNTPYSVKPMEIPERDWVPGTKFDLAPVGGLEPFYLTGGVRAYLFAVRETDNTVGFRVLIPDDPERLVYTLAHTKVGFATPPGAEPLAFSAKTKYVRYLQIDNKIFALSDAGEPARLFLVGANKIAKRVSELSMPGWTYLSALEICQPSEMWINKYINPTVTRNLLKNPSFELGLSFWNLLSGGEASVSRADPYSGTQHLEIRSTPTRTNFVTSPLHNVAGTGLNGWFAETHTSRVASSSWLNVVRTSAEHPAQVHSGLLKGLKEELKYKLAFDYTADLANTAHTSVLFYRSDGSPIGRPKTFRLPAGPTTQRFESPEIQAPTGSVQARVFFGVSGADAPLNSARFRNVILCKAEESTDIFHGGSGTDYSWLADTNNSPSVYWPPRDVVLQADPVFWKFTTPLRGSIYVKRAVGTGADIALELHSIDRRGDVIASDLVAAASSISWARHATNVVAHISKAIFARMTVTVLALAKDTVVHLDAGMISETNTLPGYFDGSTLPTDKTEYLWDENGSPHTVASLAHTTVDDFAPPMGPNIATPTANTLLTGPTGSSSHKMGFFYTFENEVGESAPSKIQEIRVNRPHSQWKWQAPNASSEPDSGAPTTDEYACADQLYVKPPDNVYARAVNEGATHWNLYMMSWSDQDPVPVTAQLVQRTSIYPDELTAGASHGTTFYGSGTPAFRKIGARITPANKINTDSAYLPTDTNRYNYSAPPSAGNGYVASDRIILVGGEESPASIRWSSNRPGDFINFTPSKGGGEKTLSSGNLNLPNSVVLWQNPQSVDTLTVLCSGSDGTSVCYYMSPADVTAQSSSEIVMGFEETTNTPGTLSPYGALVHNNALIRPIDKALLKSTAQNYNINHKTLSDEIANMWTSLTSKEWIIATVNDNRIYLLVHNPYGEALPENCLGNEIWVHDTQGDQNGTWSRFLIPAAAIQNIEYGGQTYVCVVGADGIYYLDPDARVDNYTAAGTDVLQRDIPWFFEMNTQGANRARDAWAHLQQISVMFNNYNGTAKYGIRGRTVNNKNIQVEKEFTDPTSEVLAALTWDVEDHLLIRRDLKEWYFYAGSVEGKHGSGGIGFVQYRFTPVTVNVGYEHGSVESFEYGRNTASGPDIYSQVGIVKDTQDFSWERT